MLPPKIAVVGLGVSGKSAYQVAARRGIEVCGFDQSKPSDFDGLCVIDPDARELASAVATGGYPVAVVSPGIPIGSDLLVALRCAGIELWSEVELAWRLQESGTHAGRPWLVVTGTNGKTTTVGVLTAILGHAGVRVAEVGNVGLPITSQVDTDAEVFVVEISSFQLETTVSMRPELSICLNIESDHVDWHGSVEDYRNAKGRVYDRTKKARFYFDGDQLVKHLAEAAIEAADSELVAIGGAYLPIEDHQILGVNRVLVDGDRVGFWKERGYSHALGADIQAAAALSLAYGVPAASIEAGVAQYRPHAHRQELVSTAQGVLWIDDSKATNSHAAAAVLRDRDPGSVIWIAGGDAKGQDFDALVVEVASRLKAVVLIGEDRLALRSALAKNAPGVEIYEVEGGGDPQEWMGEVVARAQAEAEPGDSVILAPACASWDQFSSYAQRGQVFAQAVLTQVGDYRD